VHPVRGERRETGEDALTARWVRERRLLAKPHTELLGPLVLIVFLVVLLDQGSKLLVDAVLSRGQSVPLVDGFVRFVYVRNSGAAFGIFRGTGTPLVFISVAASVLVLLYLLLVPPERASSRRALALVLGGALGNMVDRVGRSGEVIDFIDMGVTDRLRWPAFNVADIAVTVGVLLLVLEFLWDGRRANREPSV
jgi:signal peptidase II